MNERTANYLGLPKDHPLRFGSDTGAAWDSHTALLHPDDREEARRVWSTCLSTGTAGEFTFRVPSAEGKYRWFLTRAEPLRANDGTLLYWIGVNLDIDDTKRAEDALRKSEKELRDVIDTIPAIVWVALCPMAPILTLTSDLWSTRGHRRNRPPDQGGKRQFTLMILSDK